MRWSIFCLVGILSACAPSAPEDTAGSAAPAASSSAAIGEWQTLFDGTDLSAFMMTGDANWTIEDGAVGADAGDGGMLVTSERYSDFELELEFFVSVDANSGIFVRCDDPNDVGANTCYEINIYDTRPDQTYRTGGVVNFAEPAVILYTGGRWNRYAIVAEGSQMRVVLNGEEVVDMQDGTYADGHITLQYGSGVVKFRNVRIRRL
jgi:hypothetical protein